MSDLALEDIDIVGTDIADVDESVKLHGPPGTGKTTNAAARVAKLIQEYDYGIGDVVWITYRRSLAIDTLRRLADWGVINAAELSDPRRGPTKYIGTAHAVANRVCGKVGEPVNYGDKKRFCKKRDLRYDKNAPWDQPPGQLLFDVFNYANKNLLDPTQQKDLRKIPAVEDLREEYSGSITRAYEDWEAYKSEKEKIDFWEMLAAPIRQNVGPNRDILVIDEYHDAYPLMAKLAEKWAGDAEIVIVAGDPHQVVNTYDGADPEFFKRMDYPEVLLPTSYRVPFEHWEPASAALAKAHDPPDVERVSRGSFAVRESPTFSHSEHGWSVPNSQDRYSPQWIVEEYGLDTMFLTRTTTQLDGIARALEKAGVLFESPLSSDVPDWKPRSNDKVNARVVMFNALQKIKRLGPAAFDEHGATARLTNAHAVDPKRVRLTTEEAAMLLDHAQAKHLKDTRKQATKQANSWLIEEDTIITAADIDEHVKPAFWGKYTNLHRSIRPLIKRGRATNTMLKERDFYALGNALQKHDGPIDAKNIQTKVYTIHASKGNEARNVVVYDGITSRVAESMQRCEKEEKNEYRTWYVALTRSSENLLVLKGAFDFTKPFLPSGKRLLQLAADGEAIARGGEA